MADFTPLSVHKLRDELLTHPLMLSVGSFSLSTFMSRSIYGTIDWRPILIVVASDILAIGLDHYFDQADSMKYAEKTGNREMGSVFTQARALLFSSVALLMIAMILSPPSTWLMVAIFFGPAFVWDFKLFVFGGSKKAKKTGAPPAKTDQKKNAFTIKRIPGMKAIMIGVIRGCGTFAVVNSVLSKTIPQSAPVVAASAAMWSPSQIIIWSTINRACHAVMADVRDFHEDWEKQVPTIPVLLKSVFRTKVLLTAAHVLTMWLYAYNPYIIFASLYAIALVWILNENSPRGLYRLSFHSQTLVALVYGGVQFANHYMSYQTA